MGLYKNKFRIESSRLKNWDYKLPGYYFVTLCTKNREPYLGGIVDNKMLLSNIGHIAKQYWTEIPLHFQNVQLDEYIIMPNHVHGIIIITNSAETQNNNNNKFGPQSKNLGSIIRGYKTGVKKWSTINHVKFFWQPRFYDRIIRNEKELDKIRQYITNNEQIKIQ